MSRKRSNVSHISERCGGTNHAGGTGNDGRHRCRDSAGEGERPGNSGWRNRGNDPEFEEVCRGIDNAAVDAGLILADLFRTVSMAAACLPEMDMRTGMFSVVTDEDSITVRIAGLGKLNSDTGGGGGSRMSGFSRTESGGNDHSEESRKRRCSMEDPGYEETFWQPDDEEEERVYDEY